MKKDKITLIISENDVIEIFSRFDKIRQIDLIFTFNINIEQDDGLKERITGVFTNNEELISVIYKKKLKLFIDNLRHLVSIDKINVMYII